MRVYWMLVANCVFLWQTTLIAPALVFIFFLHLFSHINKTLTSDLLILLCFYSYTECFPFRSELITFVVVYTHTLFRAYCIRVTIFQLYFFFCLPYFRSHRLNRLLFVLNGRWWRVPLPANTHIVSRHKLIWNVVAYTFLNIYVIFSYCMN